MKIAIVGAGGHVFPLRLMNDFLSFPRLQDAHYALMDIDPRPLARNEALVRSLVEAHSLPAKVAATTDLGAALDRADVVVTCFQVGGTEAYGHDVLIPRRFGVDQTVGDTLGPGGIFRGLRTMAALETITRVMRERCPDALLLNYANPMSINCLFASAQGITTIGLCHSVQHTADALAAILGVADRNWSFRSAGINHQAWMLEFRVDGRDVLPELREAVRAYRRGDREPVPALDEHYAGNRERIRTEIMELTGYFQTESSHHASEYYPHFRRSDEQSAQLLPDRWDYYAIGLAAGDEELEALVAQYRSGRLTPGVEYAARIVDSIAGDEPRTVYGNVPNTGLITNLPSQACVEVPILVDGSGIQPTVVGDLPVPCATVNLPSIAVQLATVEAFRTRSRDQVVAAVALDRLTAALVDLDGIRAMVDAMLAAEARWLPEFL